MMICPCGKEIKGMVFNFYQSAIFDDKGNIISGICIHGKKIGEKFTPPMLFMDKKRTSIDCPCCKEHILLDWSKFKC
jgi:hypothetical protein